MRYYCIIQIKNAINVCLKGYLPTKKRAPGDTIASFKYSKACHLEERLHLFCMALGHIWVQQLGVIERQLLTQSRQLKQRRLRFGWTELMTKKGRRAQAGSNIIETKQCSVLVGSQRWDWVPVLALTTYRTYSKLIHFSASVSLSFLNLRTSIFKSYLDYS